MKDQSIVTALKGMMIGATMLVPGVSGGTMAMLLGIYSRLIASVSSFRKDKKGNFLFLTIFTLGGILGMLLFARPISFLIEAYPMPMLYFFLGAVAGGVPLILKEAKIPVYSWKIPVYILLGVGILAVFSILSESGAQLGMWEGNDPFLYLLLAGMIAAVALILPGLSVSYLLLVMGLYDRLMDAISGLRISFLLPMGVGIAVGILLSAKILERVMYRFPNQTYLIILGFVLASVAEIFPGFPSVQEFPICVITGAAGFMVIFLMAKMTGKNI